MKRRDVLVLLLVLVLLTSALLFALRGKDAAAWSDPGDQVSLPVAPEPGPEPPASGPAQSEPSEPGPEPAELGPEPSESAPDQGLTLDSVSAADFRADSPYVELYHNEPNFNEADRSNGSSFEDYAPLDDLGRCVEACANLGLDLMPTQERGSISEVHPSGWVSTRYDNVEGKNLYNRCHLIGWQLAGEDANPQNLITGTRYMNVAGMLPFENQVADYIRKTGNHVLYRVTPVFRGDNLVADGVQMEARSLEDQGEGICFNVFCFNAQPGIFIDYATGESHPDPSVGFPEGNDGEVVTYILNTHTHRFHLPDCSGLNSMKEKNRDTFIGTRAEIVAQGYVPCGSCKP